MFGKLPRSRFLNNSCFGVSCTATFNLFIIAKKLGEFALGYDENAVDGKMTSCFTKSPN